MLNSLVLVISMAGIWSVLCAPPPSPLYHSKGPNQVLNNEGSNVVTISGHDFLTDVEPEDCAESCDWLRRKCECCNSFSYNPSRRSCYLKKRQNTMDNSTSIDGDGWQSYWYWGWVSGLPGGGYTGGLPDRVFAASIGGPIGGFYDISYVSQGKGKLALNEGQPLKTTSGADKLTSVGNKRCSEECNAVPQCDGIAYNQRSGDCFLKANSGAGKFQTKDDNEGWTFYWKMKHDLVDNKCFCTCQTNYICVLCNADGSCDSI